MAFYVFTPGSWRGHRNWKHISVNAFWVTAKASLASQRFLQHLGLTACQLFARTIWVTIINQKGMQRSYGPFITWLAIVTESDKGRSSPCCSSRHCLLTDPGCPADHRACQEREWMVKPAACGLTVREVAHLPPYPLTAFPSLNSTKICSYGTPDCSSLSQTPPGSSLSIRAIVCVVSRSKDAERWLSPVNRGPLGQCNWRGQVDMIKLFLYPCPCGSTCYNQHL